MFYEKHKSSYLVIISYYVIDTVYTLMEKIDKHLTLFGDAYVKSIFVFIACGVQLDKRANPRELSFGKQKGCECV